MPIKCEDWNSRELLLLLVLAAGCVESGPRPTDSGNGGLGSQTGGGTSNGGSANQTAGGGNTANDGGLIGPTDPPPAPPTNDVAQPIGMVTNPNIKVLPWAGFKGAVTYTFDDSQPSQIEHWPELKATAASLTFFINASANWQSGYDASWSEVAAAGCELGSHTWSHCYSSLSGCTPVGDQNAELDNNANYIVTHLGQSAVYSFAAPFGDTGWNAWATPRYLLDRGVISGMIPATGASDWYNLPVFQVAAGQIATDFNAGIDNARSQASWTIFMFHSILPTTNNWFAGVDISDITTSIAHAQSLGDVWLDNITPIAAYCRAKQLFESLKPSGNTWTWTLPAHMPPGKVLRVTIDGGSLSQSGTTLTWNSHGYYEVSLDAGNLTWTL